MATIFPGGFTTVTSALLIEQLDAADNKFHRPAASCVYAEYVAFVATGEYPYNDSVVTAIATRYQVAAHLWAPNQEFRHQVAHDFLRDTGCDLIVKLHHEVYLASQQLRLAKMIEKEAALLADGFRPITELEPAVGQRITLQSGTSYRVVSAGKGRWGLLAPRKRTYGIDLADLRSQHTCFEESKQLGNIGRGNPSVHMFKLEGSKRR